MTNPIQDQQDLSKAYQENLSEKISIELSISQINSILNIFSNTEYNKVASIIPLFNQPFESFLHEKIKSNKDSKIITDLKPDIIS